MRRSTVIGIMAALLLSVAATSSRGSFISYGQSVNFTYYNSSFWAMVYDYTDGYQESSTPGFVNYDYYLNYYLGAWDVQVAYIYNVASGRYVEALALRDVLL